MTLRTIYHVVDFCWRNQGIFHIDGESGFAPQRRWFKDLIYNISVYEFIYPYHISPYYIYIYISALYTIDVEIESARHPQVCPRNCFNTFPLTRPKDGPLPSGSQSCLENARGWFLVFDFHSKPGKWWPLPGYMEFHPPIDKHIYIFGTMAIKAMYSRNFPLPCLIAEGISMWKMLTATGNLQGLQLQEDWSPRWCRQPLNAAALNTVMGSKKKPGWIKPHFMNLQLWCLFISALFVLIDPMGGGLPEINKLGVDDSCIDLNL